MKTDFSKLDAIRIVTIAAKEYKEKLEGKNLLFVFLNGDQVESFETLNVILSAVRYLDKAKMTGLFSSTGLKLVVDRLVGTTSYSIGFKKKGDYYLPSSCLLEDIRKMVSPWSRIIAVFSKPAMKKGNEYSSKRYIAKGYSFDESTLPADISTIEGILSAQKDRK